MTPRNQKQLIYAVNYLLIAGIIAALSLAFLLPLDVGQAPSTQKVPIPPMASCYQPGPLGQYQSLGEMNLRAPLFDAKPEAVAPPPPPKLNAQLTGTIMEPGFTYAIFRTGDGGDQTIGVGQSIEGAEVLEIAASSVKIRYAGSVMTLTPAKSDEP